MSIKQFMILLAMSTVLVLIIVVFVISIHESVHASIDTLYGAKNITITITPSLSQNAGIIGLTTADISDVPKEYMRDMLWWHAANEIMTIPLSASCSGCA